MRLRSAVVLIALLPLVAASLAMAWVVQQRSKVVAQTQAAAVLPVLLAARKAELQNYINLGRSAVAHLVRDGMPDPQAQQQALAILKRLDFGHDGFFFVYDFNGNNLVHPRQPELQGRNLLDLQDSRGGYPIQRMLAQARAGGGYVEFEWPRPSTGQVENKLGYVEPIAGWEWMLGTGTYVDEPEQARLRIAQASADAVVDTLTRIATIALLATLAVVAFGLVVNLNEQRKADARLRDMARQLVMSQEVERARVARELHDGVSQWLVSVKYLFEAALEGAKTQRGDEVVQPLQAGLQRLREVLGEVRRISHDLRPALLDDLGLPRALEHLAQEWQQRSGVSVDFQSDDLPDLPEAVATALFRVAQEALGNVENHAQARQVRMRLERAFDQGLRLEISDDGRGFDLQAAARDTRRGLGLTHMRERMEILGGQLELRSGADGTVLKATLLAAALQV
jgi:two-component system NarL family sensor kinase